MAQAIVNCSRTPDSKLRIPLPAPAGRLPPAFCRRAGPAASSGFATHAGKIKVDNPVVDLDGDEM